MNKYYGAVGYAMMVESAPSVYTEEIFERKYMGDIQRQGRRLQSSDHVNDGIVTTNIISIVADPYANRHFHEIRYVECWGIKWKVSSVEVQFPRLILTLGEEYHGEEQT